MATDDSGTVLQLKVKTLQPAIYDIEVPADATVLDVKQKLLPLVNTALDQLKLIFRGHVLSNEARLRDEGVASGHTLHLILRQAPGDADGPNAAAAAQTQRRNATGPQRAPGNNMDFGAMMQQMLAAQLGAINEATGGVAVPISMTISSDGTMTAAPASGDLPWEALGTTIGNAVAQQVYQTAVAAGRAPARGAAGAQGQNRPLGPHLQLLGSLNAFLGQLQRGPVDLEGLARDRGVRMPSASGAAPQPDFFHMLPSFPPPRTARPASLTQYVDAYAAVLEGDTRPEVAQLLRQARATAELLQGPGNEASGTRAEAGTAAAPAVQDITRLHHVAVLDMQIAEQEIALDRLRPAVGPSPASLQQREAALEQLRRHRTELAHGLPAEVSFETFAPFVELTRLSVATLLRRSASVLRTMGGQQLEAAADALDVVPMDSPEDQAAAVTASARCSLEAQRLGALLLELCRILNVVSVTTSAPHRSSAVLEGSPLFISSDGSVPLFGNTDPYMRAQGVPVVPGARPAAHGVQIMPQTISITTNGMRAGLPGVPVGIRVPGQGPSGGTVGRATVRGPGSGTQRSMQDDGGGGVQGGQQGMPTAQSFQQLLAAAMSGDTSMLPPNVQISSGMLPDGSGEATMISVSAAADADEWADMLPAMLGGMGTGTGNTNNPFVRVRNPPSTNNTASAPPTSSNAAGTQQRAREAAAGSTAADQPDGQQSAGSHGDGARPSAAAQADPAAQNQGAAAVAAAFAQGNGGNVGQVSTMAFEVDGQQLMQMLQGMFGGPGGAIPVPVMVPDQGGPGGAAAAGGGAAGQQGAGQGRSAFQFSFNPPGSREGSRGTSRPASREGTQDGQGARPASREQRRAARQGRNITIRIANGPDFEVDIGGILGYVDALMGRGPTSGARASRGLQRTRARRPQEILFDMLQPVMQPLGGEIAEGLSGRLSRDQVDRLQNVMQDSTQRSQFYASMATAMRSSLRELVDSLTEQLRDAAAASTGPSGPRNSTSAPGTQPAQVPTPNPNADNRAGGAAPQSGGGQGAEGRQTREQLISGILQGVVGALGPALMDSLGVTIEYPRGTSQGIVNAANAGDLASTLATGQGLSAGANGGSRAQATAGPSRAPTGPPSPLRSFPVGEDDCDSEGGEGSSEAQVGPADKKQKVEATTMEGASEPMSTLPLSLPSPAFVQGQAPAAKNQPHRQPNSAKGVSQRPLPSGMVDAGPSASPNAGPSASLSAGPSEPKRSAKGPQGLGGGLGGGLGRRLPPKKPASTRSNASVMQGAPDAGAASRQAAGSSSPLPPALAQLATAMSQQDASRCNLGAGGSTQAMQLPGGSQGGMGDMLQMAQRMAQSPAVQDMASQLMAGLSPPQGQRGSGVGQGPGSPASGLGGLLQALSQDSSAGQGGAGGGMGGLMSMMMPMMQQLLAGAPGTPSASPGAHTSGNIVDVEDIASQIQAIVGPGTEADELMQRVRTDVQQFTGPVVQHPLSEEYLSGYGDGGADRQEHPAAASAVKENSTA